MCQPTVLADSALIHINYFARYGLTKMGAATAPDGTGAAEKLLNRSVTPWMGQGTKNRTAILCELSQEYEPVDESTMPYLVDIRAIKHYADSKGVGITALSDEEKQRFMIPNPNYRKRRRHGIAAVF